MAPNWSRVPSGVYSSPPPPQSPGVIFDHYLCKYQKPICVQSYPQAAPRKFVIRHDLLGSGSGPTYFTTSGNIELGRGALCRTSETGDDDIDVQGVPRGSQGFHEIASAVAAGGPSMRTHSCGAETNIFEGVVKL